MGELYPLEGDCWGYFLYSYLSVIKLCKGYKSSCNSKIHENQPFCQVNISQVINKLTSDNNFYAFRIPAIACFRLL